MISLRNLLKEESFTAINKDSGEVSVFKTKDARDSAIKSGTHDKQDSKSAKGGDSPTDKKDVPKVNIFNKDKKEPKKAKFKDFKKDIDSTMTDMDFSSSDLGGMDGTNDFEDSDGNYMSISKGKLFDDPNKFAVFGGKVDDMTDASADNNYKSFNSKEDAVAYAKELGQKLKGGKEDEPKKDEPKDSANSRPGNPQVNKVVRKKAASLGITPQKLGKEEYESRMSKAAVEALTDANFHSEARKLIAVLEDKPEWANDPRKDKNMPDISSPEYEKWQKTSVYSSTFYDSAEGTDDLAHAATGEAGWDGVSALDAIAFDLKMSGSKKLAAKIQGIIDDTNESTTSLKDLLPESVQINEGTRSQVGVIGRNGKIVSAYVHYDGYPSNMKPGLKKHMKNEKDVLKLIKMGGARGIFDDKEIEYYKSGNPTKGDIKDFGGYVDAADRSGMAEFVYLYNIKDKKWYFADVYGDKKLKKLY